MNTSIKISVIIPCYNLGQYIDEAVDSVLSQTYTNYEIIIVNDGSTDILTNKILKNFNKPKTSIYNIKNSGVAEARNFGISKAKGEFIACLDADDKYDPQFLEKTIKILEKSDNQVGFVTTWIQLFGNKLGIHKTFEYNPAQLGYANVVHVASLFKKSIWKEVGGYDEETKGYQDWEFWIAIIEKGYTWQNITEPLFMYRIRDDSMLMDANKLELSLYQKIIQRHLGYFRKYILNILLLYRKNQIYERKGRKSHVAKLKDMGQLVEHQENIIQQKDQQIQKKDQQIQQKDRQIQQKDQQIQRKKCEIEFMRSSKFWRVRDVYIHYISSIKQGIKQPSLIIIFFQKRIEKISRYFSE